MRRTLKESFVPILGVLGLIFLLLLFVRYQVGLDADEVTVITIHAPLAGAVDGDVPEETLASYDVADQQISEALQLIAQRKWGEADFLLQQLTAKRDDSPSWATLGVLRYRQQRPADALSLLQRAEGKTPIWFGLYFYRALVKTQLHQLNEAQQDYRTLIELNPNHFEAHYNLGLLLLRESKTVEAVALLQRAVQLAGGERRARAYYQLGRAWQAQGEDSRGRAAENFHLAIRHLPAYVAPRLALARMEPDSAEGRAAATEQLHTVLELEAGNPAALFALAQLEAAAGDTRGAIARYRELLQYSPEHLAGRYNLGLLLLKDKKWEEAREHFTQVIEHEPMHVTAYFNRGRAAYRLKHYDAALADYQKAQALNEGDYPEALLNIGLVQTAMEEYSAAEQSYRQALTLRQDYESAWYNLGLLFMRQDKGDEAVVAFLRAVALREDYPQAWYNLGLLYARKEQNTESIAAYETALKFRPDYTNARINLAVRLMRQKQPQRAIEHYRLALEHDASYATAWYNLALAYMESRQYAEVEASLQRMLELEPDSVKARSLLAKSLMSHGNSAAAVIELEKAVEIEANNAALRLALAQALRAAGELPRARAELYKGLALKPDHTELRQELASLDKLFNTTDGDRP
jgi:tetratricopeptide (TPR) repeat protein